MLCFYWLVKFRENGSVSAVCKACKHAFFLHACELCMSRPKYSE